MLYQVQCYYMDSYNNPDDSNASFAMCGCNAGTTFVTEEMYIAVCAQQADYYDQAEAELADRNVYIGWLAVVAILPTVVLLGGPIVYCIWKIMKMIYHYVLRVISNYKNKKQERKAAEMKDLAPVQAV